MCLTIPAKVVKIHGNKAVIKQGDVQKTISIKAVSEVTVGDWVLYMSDIAVQKVDKKDAKEILELLEHVQKTDPDTLDPQFVKIIKNSKERPLEKEEIEYLLKCEGREAEALFSEADMMRRANINDFFCIHGIIEFSNYCINDCAYCGLRKENATIKRYRMPIDEIVETVDEAVRGKGYKLIVLQSGDDPYYTKEKLVEMVKKIKEKTRVFIFMSIGQRDYETYKELREAGANGVLFRFESSNPDLFKKIHKNGKDLKTRIEHLKFMKELNYFIASGSIIGLPGQTISDLADDIITMRENKFDMISMGPFVPCKHTPFENDNPGTEEMNLKMISILRLEMKDTKIPVVTALETLDPVNGRKNAIQAGANSLMFNLTPEKYAEHYEIYKRKEALNTRMWEKYGLYNTDESYKMLEEKLTLD
ncbi:[FeFe] hydrogenase H-cluster radical SAM maturase HydE [Candidatus Peregrinibacteria bacterium]|nr:[FeFe] hydrogenase H-cluster radical SAM maturase HydE [Candidatus Peregrinibacteria bacterium]